MTFSVRRCNMDDQPVLLPDFESPVGGIMQEYIAEKKALGFCFETEARALRNFDRFLVASGLRTCTLPRKLIDEWTRKKEKRSPATHQKRVRQTRRFAQFMIVRGFEAYVPDPRF